VPIEGGIVAYNGLGNAGDKWIRGRVETFFRSQEEETMKGGEEHLKKYMARTQDEKKKGGAAG